MRKTFRTPSRSLFPPFHFSSLQSVFCTIATPIRLRGPSLHLKIIPCSQPAREKACSGQKDEGGKILPTDQGEKKRDRKRKNSKLLQGNLTTLEKKHHPALMQAVNCLCDIYCPKPYLSTTSMLIGTFKPNPRLGTRKNKLYFFKKAATQIGHPSRFY